LEFYLRLTAFVYALVRQSAWLRSHSRTHLLTSCQSFILFEIENSSARLKEFLGWREPISAVDNQGVLTGL
jgi:hypothetical protein